MLDFDTLELRGPLSPTSASDPDYVLAAKSAFNRLGYYEVPAYGLTPYPDQPLFDGIREYQRDSALTVDGYMLPSGETEQSVNNSLAGKLRTAMMRRTTAARTLRFNRGNCRGAPCLGAISVLCRASEKMRKKANAAARARCWASANERRVLCERGRKRADMPDLDIGEW